MKGEKKVIRHQKILRDSIQGITKPAIERLCQRAGLVRKQGLIFEEFRGHLKLYIEDLLRQCINITEYARRKTLKTKDLVAALKIRGEYLGIGTNPDIQHSIKGKANTIRPTKQKIMEPSGVKKPHRFKPGTVALREVRFQQKHSDALIFPRTSFYRLMKEIAQDYADETKFSKNFVELFQLTTEIHMTKLLQNATLGVVLAGRKTITPKDMQFARRIMGSGSACRLTA